MRTSKGWAILLRKPSPPMNGTPVYAGFPPSGWVSTIAGALFVVAFLFLIIFGLPGLFAGV